MAKKPPPVQPIRNEEIQTPYRTAAYLASQGDAAVALAAAQAAQSDADDAQADATSALSKVPTLMGTAVISEMAAAAGIREVTVALAGVAVGGRYLAFSTSYKLNGGSSVPGRPPSYSLIDAVCNTVDQITISLNAPLLGIGDSYEITCSVVRINT